MRITSGWLRNRRFEVPKGDVRPTMESVREALFSSLGGSCEGWRVLDLFAGSGALGLEAWSRGAEHVRFVEKQSAAECKSHIVQYRGTSYDTSNVEKAPKLHHGSYRGVTWDA